MYMVLHSQFIVHFSLQNNTKYTKSVKQILGNLEMINPL